MLITSRKSLTAALVSLTLSIGLAACSSSPSSPDHGAQPVMQTQDSSLMSSSQIFQGQDQPLYKLLQQRDFSQAFHAMQGTSELPAWVNNGGTSTPAEGIVVNGKDVLLSEACKPHNCPSEKIVLLYDPGHKAMQGAFAQDPTPSVDAGMSDKAEYRWLGEPDKATREWLQKHIQGR